MENNRTQMGGVYPLHRAAQSLNDSSRDSRSSSNLLSDLVPDEIYYALQEQGLFDEKAIRDYHIRKAFKEFRKQMGTTQAIEKLQQVYPYLQFDTLRKIVYQLSKKKD